MGWCYFENDHEAQPWFYHQNRSGNTRACFTSMLSGTLNGWTRDVWCLQEYVPPRHVTVNGQQMHVCTSTVRGAREMPMFSYL